MLLCLDCFKVYNQKTIKNNQCKVKTCNGEVVEIDELFIPVVAELNKKSYNTLFCCSGHIDNNYVESYIYFDKKIKLPYLPKGYTYNQDLYPHVNFSESGTGRCIIRKEFNQKQDINILSKNILNNAIEVLNWAESLPTLNK